MYFNLLGLFNANAILVKEQKCYYLTDRCVNKGNHTFPRSICQNAKVIAQLAFEHTFFVQHFWLPRPKLIQIYIYVCIFTNRLARVGCDTMSIFKRSLTGFWFGVFLLLDWLPNRGLRTQSSLLFIHSWTENNWNHTFPKDISVMQYAVSLVQDLNSYSVSVSYNDNHHTTVTCVWAW